jgi:cystathionine beta-lyase/cystathionine gamma-synthase
MTRRKKPRPYTVRPETAVLTRGFDPRLSVGSARPAVFRSSTYVFSSPESAERAFAIALGKQTPSANEDIDLIYSRISHPNAEILEDQVVPLETGATTAAVFNSGMAAIATVFLALCRPGSSIVYTVPVYGGTHHLLHELLESYGVRPVPVPAGDAPSMLQAIESAPELAIVFVETPANPTLRMTDIASTVAAAATREPRPLVVVDNTLLGPVFQHPLLLGADLAIYSATKYLAGFSDMLGGIVLGREPDLADQLRGHRVILGNILQPDECWLLDTRLPTVSLRMNRQSKNAERIVHALTEHPRVERMHYPTCFRERDQIEIYAAQCDYPGGIFSLDLKGGRRAAYEFLRRLRIARNAVSLGGMESLACHPRTTTHSEMSPEELEQAGIGEGLVRISVGIEDWRDLARDFEDALDAL